jgi:hypothetical protein
MFSGWRSGDGHERLLWKSTSWVARTPVVGVRSFSMVPRKNRGPKTGSPRNNRHKGHLAPANGENPAKPLHIELNGQYIRCCDTFHSSFIFALRAAMLFSAAHVRALVDFFERPNLE